MCTNFFPSTADLRLDAPHRMHRFYAALLTLSLILGKIFPAQAQVPPASPSTTTVTNANIAPRLSAADRDVLAARGAFERRDLKALASARDRLRNAEGQAHQLALYAQFWWLSANLAQARSP